MKLSQFLGLLLGGLWVFSFPARSSSPQDNTSERRVQVQVAAFELRLREVRASLRKDYDAEKQRAKQKNQSPPAHNTSHPIFLKVPYRSRLVGASPLVLWHLERRGWGKWLVPQQNRHLRSHESSDGARLSRGSYSIVSIRSIRFVGPDKAKIFLDSASVPEANSEFEGSGQGHLYLLERTAQGWQVKKQSGTWAAG